MGRSCFLKPKQPPLCSVKCDLTLGQGRDVAPRAKSQSRNEKWRAREGTPFLNSAMEGV